MTNLPCNFVEVLLQPGEFHFGAAHTRIRTLLGSCVSITAWHPQWKVGGMCHYLLPSRNRDVADRLDGRYADEALEMFLAEMRSIGTQPDEYAVKLFGGGAMFSKPCVNDAIDVPQRNVAAGLALAKRHGLKIHARDLGGTEHRTVAFDIWSGDVWVRQNRGAAAESRKPVTSGAAA